MKSLSKLLATAVLAGLMALAFASPAAAQIGPEHDGLWDSPELERQGLSIEAWPAQENGRDAGAFVVWYTYAPGGPEQAWLISDIFEPGQDTAPCSLPPAPFPACSHPPGDETAGARRQHPNTTNRARPAQRALFGVRVSTRLRSRVVAGPSPDACIGDLTFRRLTPPPD